METDVVGVRASLRKSPGGHGFDSAYPANSSTVAGATLLGHELP